MEILFNWCLMFIVIHQQDCHHSNFSVLGILHFSWWDFFEGITKFNLKFLIYQKVKRVSLG